jgi:hypothetical protein
MRDDLARVRELGFAPNQGGGLGALPAPEGESIGPSTPGRASTICSEKEWEDEEEDEWEDEESQPQGQQRQ